jgi:ATP-dependent HslUV protease ATP-binding subunit HslU
MERLLEEVSFSASEGGFDMVAIDAGYVDSRLAELAKNEDLSRYVL